MNFLRNSKIDIFFVRVGILVILISIGSTKFFEFEVQALIPLISKTYLSVLYSIFGHHVTSYLLGIYELIACLFIVLGLFKPRFGVLAGLMVAFMALVTLSLMLQAGVDPFILKDVLLLASGLVLARHEALRAAQ